MTARTLTIMAAAVFLAGAARAQTSVYALVDAESHVHVYHTAWLIPGDSVHVDRRRDGGAFQQLTERALRVMSPEAFDQEIADVLTQVELESGRVGASAVRSLLLSEPYAGEIYASAYPSVARALGRVYVDESVTSGELYNYRVRVFRAGSVSSSDASVDVRIEPFQPVVPTGLRARHRDRAVTLVWNYPSNSGLVIRFEALRRTPDGYKRIRERPVLRISESDTFSVSFLADRLGEEETYVVRAVDVAGQLSGYSEPLAYTVDDNVAPEPPSSVQVVDGISPATITWAPSASLDVDAYRVYRAEGSSRDTLMLSPLLPADVSIFTDSSVLSNRNYRYFVTAIDAMLNESKLSDGAAFAVVDRAPPDPPGAPEVTIQDDGTTARIRWAASSAPDVYFYRLTRERRLREHYEPPLVLVDSLLTDVLDAGPRGMGLEAGAFYRYSVAAIDSTYNTSDTTHVVFQVPDHVPPAVPDGLHAYQTRDGHAGLTWSLPADRDLDAIRVWIDDQAVATLGSGETAFTYREVDVATQYAFQVSAVDSVGNESARTEPVQLKIVDRTPPPAVLGLAFADGVLRWVPAIVSDLAAYRIACGAYATGPFETASEIVGSTAHYTPGPDVGRWCVVSGVDTSGNEGPTSAAVDVGGSR